jgi:uncharacterized protein YbaR (Trm112 family)
VKRFFKFLFKSAALAGVAVGLVKALDAFRGSPEGVGEEGFALSGSQDEGSDEDPYAVDEATLGGDVSPELIERLVCPLDKGPLELVDGKWLVNRRNGYRYPISDGIPVMLVEVGERYRDAELANASKEA